MSVPQDVRRELKHRLWDLADRIMWMNLPQSEKAKYYEGWTRDSAIGGVLSRYIDKGHVRVYLKDSLLKDYARDRLADRGRPFRVLDISPTIDTAEIYIKPHGRKLMDGRVICWGRADDWKLVLMAVHERACAERGAQPFAAVLFQAAGRFKEPNVRAVVEDASKRLGIQRLIWLES